MKPDDAEAIEMLRSRAMEPYLVADLVSAVISARAPSVPHPLDVVKLFEAAFNLNLEQTKPIADWLIILGGNSDEDDDADLHASVAPYIEANRPIWMTVAPQNR